MYNSYKLLVAPEKDMKELGKLVGQRTFRYFWLSYDIIFLDLIIQVLNYHLNIF
jgi:hypothetical protein